MGLFGAMVILYLTSDVAITRGTPAPKEAIVAFHIQWLHLLLLTIKWVLDPASLNSKREPLAPFCILFNSLNLRVETHFAGHAVNAHYSSIGFWVNRHYSFTSLLTPKPKACTT